MPKPRTKQSVTCEYFNWLLGTRNGVYTADGRSNTPSAGRHSLGTRNYEEARSELRNLDRVMAVSLGMAEKSILDTERGELLPFKEGRRLYEDHIMRPQIAGGPTPKTRERYRAVLDKFMSFAEKERLSCWNQVDRSVLERYATWLDGEHFAYATEYLELNTIKQIVKWMVETGLLPPECRIVMPFRKPEGTDTYCWRQAEVRAIRIHCDEHGDLVWLGQVTSALACTGLRISELASLRWSDLDLQSNSVRLTDETTSAKQRKKGKPRSTKNHRGRTFPIHESLRRVLDGVRPTADGLVFHGPRGGVLKPDTVRRILIRDVLTPLACQFPTAAGEIGFSDGRLHSFRHYFCSSCANSGVPEQVVMRWLGHSSSRMVRHYYHLHDEESQRHMQRLDFLGESGARDAG